jgi:transposase InsO family protein
MGIEEDKQDAVEELLSKIYYDPKTGFGSLDQLFRQVKSHKITRKTVKTWLDKQDTQQVHQRKRRKIFYPITSGGADSYQADLTFYAQFKKHNKLNGKQVIGLLTCVNIHTRKGYAKPITGKGTKIVTFETAGSVLKSMADILSELEVPMKNLTTDQGGEFVGGGFQALMKKHSINHTFADANDHRHMGKIERFNRTIRDKLNKWMSATNSVEWVSIIDDLMENYNNTYHSSIKATPNEAKASVVIKADAERVRKVDALSKKFKVGDHVRLLREKGIFEKNVGNFEVGIYTISEVNSQSYQVIDDMGVELQRTVQHYELVKVQGTTQKYVGKKVGQNAVQAAVKDVKIDRKIASGGIERFADVDEPRPKRFRNVVKYSK